MKLVNIIVLIMMIPETVQTLSIAFHPSIHQVYFWQVSVVKITKKEEKE